MRRGSASESTRVCLLRATTVNIAILVMVMPIILEVMTHRMKIVLFEITRLCIVVPISVVFN